MQHLLDFLHQHPLEQHFYLVVDSADGELELSWRRHSADDLWQVRKHKPNAKAELVHYGDLLEHLDDRGADMKAVERELSALLVSQLAYADTVLRDAEQIFGREFVERAVAGHRDFMSRLQAAILRWVPPGPA